MAERVLQFTATIPAATPASAPVTVAMPFDGWQVESIDLEVPTGPAGTMGFYLANNDQTWISRSPGEWIVWNDHTERFYPTNYPTAGGWQIVGYNTDAYPHDVIVRFNVNPIEPAAPTTPSTPVVLTFIQTPAESPEVVVL